MTEVMNYGRASEALRIYRSAMQSFISDTLRRENGGAGDWFADSVLAKLSAPLCDGIQRKLDDLEFEPANRGEGPADSAPESLLEETHYPGIISQNWSSFNQPLKDREEVLKLTRQLKKARNKKIAHSSRQLSDGEATEIIAACLSIVERFDSTSAALLNALLKPSNPSHSPRLEGPAQGEADKDEGQRDVWTAVEQIEKERSVAADRLDDLVDHFFWAGEAMDQADLLERTLNTLGTYVEVDSDEIAAELHGIRFVEIFKDMVIEAMPFMELGETVAGTYSGSVHYSLPGSRLKGLVIEYELKE